MKKLLPAVHPADEQHMKKLRLSKNEIMQWEDGLRTDCKKGTYEWWYFDTHLSDGTIIVIVFYTKSAIKPNGPTAPYATFEITSPDGTSYAQTVKMPAKECSFSKKSCDIRIGNCTFSGDLTNYKIHFENENVIADVTLNGTVPSWRSYCGSIFFGEHEEEHFSWLPAVPEGSVSADVTINGTRTHYDGYGYHDHNWGNASMLKLMNHWYWGRAKIGPYTVISSWITAEKVYGNKEFDVFMLAKDGKIAADTSTGHVEFNPSQVHYDSVTKKPVHDKLVYLYTSSDSTQFRVTYVRQTDITQDVFTANLPSLQRILAKLMGMDGGYMRFSGNATIEKIENGVVIEKYTNLAVWELMYFGKSLI